MGDVFSQLPVRQAAIRSVDGNSRWLLLDTLVDHLMDTSVQTLGNTRVVLQDLLLLTLAYRLESGHRGANISEDGVNDLLEAVKETLGVVFIRPRCPIIQHDLHIGLTS